MRLLLLTRAMEPSAEVLPALGLLAHHVRTMPAEPTALLNAPACDALLVDGRRDLPAVRGLTRLLRQTGVDVPLLLITTEGGLAAIQWDWGMDDVIVDSSSPAEVEARLRLSVSRLQDAVGAPSEAPEEIRNGDLHIDEATYTARLRSRTLDLTFKEFELLKFLAQHPGACSPAPTSCRRSGATTTSAARARSTSTSAGCARSSASSTRASSAPSETWGTASSRSAPTRPPSRCSTTR